MTADQVQQHLDTLAASLDRRLRALEARVAAVESRPRAQDAIEDRLDALEAHAFRSLTRSTHGNEDTQQGARAAHDVDRSQPFRQ